MKDTIERIDMLISHTPKKAHIHRELKKLARLVKCEQKEMLIDFGKSLKYKGTRMLTDKGVDEMVNDYLSEISEKQDKMKKEKELLSPLPVGDKKISEIERIHILPIGDTREHWKNDYCPCKPLIETFENGNKILFHKSFDKKERFAVAKTKDLFDEFSTGAIFKPKQNKK